jgi:gliding motility-associated-like protein
VRKHAQLIAVLVSLLSHHAFAQHEASVWPMGPVAGLSFKSGEVEKLEPNDINASRVVSSISDRDGNLLFYTNGDKVWDRRHQEMPNGNGLNGSPYQSSCQIVPKPGDPNRYYIFTNRRSNWGAPNGAAHYAEVDLCLNNGMGDVVQATKNTPLMSVAANRIAVVRHDNGVDYWVAFHKWQSDALYAYRITSTGIDMSPVISRTGAYLGFSSNSTGDGGEMKFSADGKKLAMAVSQFATAEVYNFNSQTGVFTHLVRIPAMYRQNYQTPDYTFGIEFSPDGEKVYLSRTNACLLLQYDLRAGDDAAIVKSRTILVGDTLQHNAYDYYIIYGLQLAVDQKLYVAWIGKDSTGVSVIEHPNEKGLACDYRHAKVTWDVQQINPDFFYSFPTFPANHFRDRPTIRDGFDCISPAVAFYLDFSHTRTRDQVASLLWNFDDPASGMYNESNEFTSSHTFFESGQHHVRLTIQWTDGTTEVLDHLVTIPPEVVGGELAGLRSDTTLCAGSTLRLDASRLGGSVVWQDGLMQNYLDVSEPGVYSYSVCRSGCSLTDSITVHLQDVPDLFGNDTTLCETNAHLVLDAGSYGEVIGWQDDSVSPTYTVKGPGTFSVRVEINGCITADTITVQACDLRISIPNVITPNGDHANERLEVEGIGNATCELTIYNRYGSVVYHSGDYQNSWSGDDLSDGVYYYQVHLAGQSYRGWLRIIR